MANRYFSLCILGEPRTKKNSQRIVVQGGKPIIIQSKQYREYEEQALWQLIAEEKRQIDYPINLHAVYYMSRHGRVDLTNLLQATCDILVKSGILKDDNSEIVRSFNGSCVMYDKEHPRVFITIKEVRA